MGAPGTRPPPHSSGENHRGGPPSLCRAISRAASTYSLTPRLLAAAPELELGGGGVPCAARHRVVVVGVGGDGACGRGAARKRSGRRAPAGAATGAPVVAGMGGR